MNVKIAICDDEIKVLNEEVKLLEEICNEKQLICEIDKYTSSVELAVLAFFCKIEFSMIKYSVLWAGMATFWLSCLIVI